jgi:hypothetical protein
MVIPWIGERQTNTSQPSSPIFCRATVMIGEFVDFESLFTKSVDFDA